MAAASGSSARKALNVLITGASSGVGSAVARSLAKELYSRGAHLLLTGRRKKALEEVAESVKEISGGNVATTVVSADVSVAEEVASVCAALESCDVAVLNAGLNRTGQVEDTTVDDFDSVINTNVKGVYLFLRELLGPMKKQGSGQVVVTSSVLGVRGAAKASLYCASKHALEGMVDAVRLELKGTGVKIGSVRPGAIATPWWTDPARGGRPKEAPTPDAERMLTPEAVADAIVMMALQAPSSDLRTLELEPTGRS